MPKSVIPVLALLAFCGFSYGKDLSSTEKSRIDGVISKNKLLFACDSLHGQMTVGIDGKLSQQLENLRAKLGRGPNAAVMMKILELNLPMDDGERMDFVVRASRKYGDEILKTQTDKGIASGLYSKELFHKMSDADIKFRIIYDTYMANRCDEKFR